MKKAHNADLESFTVELKFKDGKKVKIEDPETVLLVYQKFDMQKIEDEYRETGVYPLKDKHIPDEQGGMGGTQIMGRSENIKFSTFTLINHLLEHLSFGEIISVVALALSAKMDKWEVEEKLRRHADKHKDDELKN